MSSSFVSHKSYVFGSFVLETSSGSLRRGGEAIPLTRKRYEILLLLVENAGRLMIKEEIFQKIWPDQYIDEANLSNNIYAIRRVIEDDPRRPKMILNVPGRGYKFQGEVRLLDASIPELNDIREGQASSDGSRNVSGWVARRGPVALIAFVIVLGAIVGGWSILGIIFTKRQPVAARPRPLTSLPGAERFPALSSDGKLIAFTWDGDELKNDDIYVKQTVESELIRITTHPSADRKPTWSPDGRFIAFLRSAKRTGEPNHLMIIPALGGAEREIARVDDGLDWSPDGKYLAITGLNELGGGSGIYLIDVNGGQRRQITEQAVNGGIYDSTPRFSPDGRSLAFLRYKDDVVGEIFIFDLTSGKIRQLTSEKKNIKSETLQWSADGQTLYFISNRAGGLYLWQVDLMRGIAEIFPNLPIPMTSFSIARESNTFVYINDQEDTQIEIFVRNRDSQRACLINSTLDDSGAIWSPDGSQIVFSSDRTGWPELWVAQKDCTQLRQLTSFREFGGGSPRWSPDGQLIAFDRRNGGRSDIYTIRVGGAELRKVTDSVSTNTMPNWSPDGEWIYFTSNRAQPHTKPQIWKIPVGGGDPMQVTAGGQRGSWAPFVSPDGKLLYFNRDDRLWRLDLPTGNQSPVGELSEHRLIRGWHIAQRGVYFLEPSSETQFLLRYLDPVTGNISLVTQVFGRIDYDAPSLSVSPDEQRFAFGTVANQVSDIMLIDGWR
jgi:Tol biopolymer transport system component/DNA-binding winged helix-turn-helix (wHTH) protein